MSPSFIKICTLQTLKMIEKQIYFWVTFLTQQDISLEEVKNCIVGLKDIKSPGNDGFTSEFYKMFSGQLSPDIQKIQSCTYVFLIHMFFLLFFGGHRSISSFITVLKSPPQCIRKFRTQLVDFTLNCQKQMIILLLIICGINIYYNKLWNINTHV